MSPASRALAFAETFLAGTAAFIAMLARTFQITTPIDQERWVHRVLFAAALAVGAWLRFWGVGSFSLQGDEETMAMATMHILQDGKPLLPSGMFYPRGLTELYLMAGSVRIFGQSEWALRLPSVLAGIATIAFAHAAGRRFLRPQWNAAFVMTVALLPALLEYSQTARMYIFMEVCVAACMACIFAWERTDRIGWLIGAVLALVVGIELHALAVTCALLFLLPGALRSDRRKYVYGLGAAVVVMVAYLAIDAWVNSNYPVPPPEYAAEFDMLTQHGVAPNGYPLQFYVALWAAGAITAALAVYLGRRIASRVPAICVTLLLLAGLAAQLLLFYHIAVLLVAVGSIVAYRFTGSRILRRLSMFTLASAMIALIHVTVLAARPGSVVKLIGAIVGQPSVWPYVRVAELSLLAAVLAVIATLWGVWRIANRQPAPDYWLLLLLGVWIPLFMIGFFLWNVPARYTAASLLPMLLGAYAFAQHSAERLAARLPSGSARTMAASAAALVSIILMIDPARTVASITSDGSEHPDHRGAAQFMRTQQLSPDDVVLAEDVLQQTYYLGHVDYWLISGKFARRFVQRVDGVIRDFYTGTQVIDSGAALEQLLREHPDHRIFVIGSGENQSDGRRQMRGFGIAEVLTSDRFEVLFVGRDGVTKVWRAKPGRSMGADSARSSAREHPTVGAGLGLDARSAAAGAE